MVIVFILIALFERLVFDFGPNIELVTTATVLSGLYLSKKNQLLVPLIIMMISDAYLGIGKISFFTWTGFLAMALGVGSIREKIPSKYLLGLGGALMGNIVFYIWTNFGVWAMDGWGMYENTFRGLMQSYAMGLPFLKMQLYSSLLFVPLGICFVELGMFWKKQIFRLKNVKFQSN